MVGITVMFAFLSEAKADFYFYDTPGKLFYDYPGKLFFWSFHLDTTHYVSDTTRYPIYDRYGDPYTYRNRNPFYLQDTSFVKKNIVYDPATKQYYIEEKIGSQLYR